MADFFSACRFLQICKSCSLTPKSSASLLGGKAARPWQHWYHLVMNPIQKAMPRDVTLWYRHGSTQTAKLATNVELVEQ